MDIPILAKLLISLVFIIIVNRISRNLFISLFFGALVFGLWSGQGPARTAEIMLERSVSISNISLLMIVGLVILLSGQMSETGMIDTMVLSVRSKLSTRTSLAVLPAIIGLLPMPGGALFSAPLLDIFDGTEGIGQESKTRINYWFRHVWEYAWPLYPGVILASSIAGVELWVFMAASLFPVAAAILLGYFFLLRPVPYDHHVKDASHKLIITPFIPIIVVTVVYALFQVLFPSVIEINRYLPMLFGLGGAILTLQRIAPLSASSWKSLILSRKLLASILIIFMVQIYGAFIEADLNGIPIAEIMTLEMSEFGIPMLPLIIILPFVAGLTLGVSVGFVGASMPVVVALLGVDPSFGSLMAHVVFAYVCGFMGAMLSPLHVCLIVTCDYYKTQLYATLYRLIPLAFLMIITGYAYSRLLLLIF